MPRLRCNRLTHCKRWCSVGLVMIGCVSHAGESGAGSEGIQRHAFQAHESIHARVRDYVRERIPESQRADARIELSRLDPRLRLPACSDPLQAFANGDRPAIGALSVGVRCAGEQPWTLYVQVRVAVFGSVVVVARPLARGARLQAQDLEVVRRDLAALPRGYFDTIDAVVGNLARQSLPAGQVLQANQVESPRLVRRGEKVILRVSSSGFEVSMSGSALSDGVMGQRIQVRNDRSKRVVEGEVVAVGAVRVSI